MLKQASLRTVTTVLEGLMSYRRLVTSRFKKSPCRLQSACSN